MLQLLHWKFFYLSILLISLGGIVLGDWRYKLVFFQQPKAAIKTVIGLVTILLIGDIIGSEWRIFSTNSQFVSGLFLGSQIPIEEILFLILISYFTLILYVLLKPRSHV